MLNSNLFIVRIRDMQAAITCSDGSVKWSRLGRVVCHDDDRKKDYRERVFEVFHSCFVSIWPGNREFGGFEKRFKRWYSRFAM